MKILTVIGARPQFIKAATISRKIAEYDHIEDVIVHTGQHFDANMSDVFFKELDISRPKYHLGIGGGSHGAMTGRQLEAVEEVMIDEEPDLVIVYGDTNSTLAGAIAAAKLHINVCHIEAGLRSFNRKMPEEINRILTDHVSDLLFAPTKIAMKNLYDEGIDKSSVYMVGDVMCDASIYYRDKGYSPVWFDGLNISLGKFVLATIHRAENTDNPSNLKAILTGLSMSGIPVVLPLHPRTRDRIKQFELKLPDGIYITDPVGYLEMVWLEANCLVVATDSGGVQKEAYFFNKPCVTMRSETEWLELAEAGWNTLVGTDSKAIAMAISNAKLPTKESSLYGQGSAADKILEVLV